MCVGAKLCSSKAKTIEEAEKLCSVPKLPKWVVQMLPKHGEPETCDLCKGKATEIIDNINLKIRYGEAEEVRDLAAKLMNDIFRCYTDDGILAFTDELMSEFNDLSKRHYLKGEGRDLEGKFEILKETIG